MFLRLEERTCPTNLFFGSKPDKRSEWEVALAEFRPHVRWTGSGQPCAVCGKPLPGEEMVVELEFNRHATTPGLDQYHLHHRCYAAWEFERSKPGTAPS